MSIRLRAGALLLALAMLTTGVSFAEAPSLHRYEASFLNLFDTFTRIVLYARDKEEAQALSQRFYTELLIYHQLYDIYNDYEGVANIKTINDQAGKAPVVVDLKIIDMIAFAKEMDLKTGGRVNVALGSVLKLWHDARTDSVSDPENAKTPEIEALREAARHTKIEDIVIDQAAGTVFLRDPKMRLDVGAIAKGYAVEQVAKTLESEGVEHALLSVGGNVRAIGGRFGGDDFLVGVQNPDLSSENQSLFRLKISGRSLVTSGDYQRYFTVNGERYHHIIDETTLFPAAYHRQVSVVCKDSGLADALSTALFNMSYEDGMALLENTQGVEALFIEKDGAYRMTAGFERLISEN